MKNFILFIIVFSYACTNTPTNPPSSIDITGVTSPVADVLGTVKKFNATSSIMKNGLWQLTLTWENASKATQYDVKRGTTSKTYTDNYPNVSSPFIISNLQPGTTHYFIVVSYHTVNNTVEHTNSEEFAINIPLDAFTEKPGDFTMTATAGDGQVTIAWEKSVGASFYIIQSGSSSGSYPNVVKRLADSPFVDTGLSNGKTRYYIVIAVNSIGSTNAKEEAVATPVVAVASDSSSESFSNMIASPGDRSVVLSWDAIPGVSSYIIKKSESLSGPFTIISDSVTTNSFTDSALVNGTAYFYKVFATDTDSKNYESSVVTASPGPLPGTFVVSGQVGASQVELTWSNASDATSYTVQYGITNGSYPMTVTENATSPYTVTNLVNGTIYYFNVIAVNASGGTNSTVSVTPIGAPGEFTVSGDVGDGSVSLSWTSSSGADSYSVQYRTSFGSYLVFSSQATSPITVTGLTNATDYYLKVVATNVSGSTDGSIGLSSEIQLTPVAPSFTQDNLSFWLDASVSDTITLQSGKVSAWADKRGGRSLTQSTTSLQPTYDSSLGGEAVVFQTLTAPLGQSLTGLMDDYSLGQQSHTIFAVYDQVDDIRTGYWNRGPNLFAIGVADFHQTISFHSYIAVGSYLYYYGNDLGCTLYKTARTVMRVSYNGTTRAIAYDGTEVISENPASPLNLGSKYFEIGNDTRPGRGGTFFGYKGKIHEMLFYKTALSPTEIAGVDNYLRNKWQTPIGSALCPQPAPIVQTKCAFWQSAYCPFGQQEVMFQDPWPNGGSGTTCDRFICQ